MNYTISKHEALVCAMMASCAVGAFVMMFIHSLLDLDTANTLETAKTIYFKLAVSACGAFFMAIMGALMYDAAND